MRGHGGCQTALACIHVDSGEAPLPFPRLLCIALLAAVAPACTPFKDDTGDTAFADGTSGGGGPIDAGPPCDPATAFGPPSVVLGLDLDSARATSVAGLRLSPDSLTAYFSAEGRPDSVGYHDLYVASRAQPTSPFVGITPIPGVNTVQEESDPTVTEDGRTLVFARSEPGGLYPVQLYGAARDPPYAFSDVEILSNINNPSPVYDMTPFVRGDGALLYFASSRVPANSIDIYSASQSGGSSYATGFAMPIPVPELNTTFTELAPVVSSDDLLIYWGSDRSDGDASGMFDIWVATRNTTLEPFANMRDLHELNSSALDLPTFVTRDGCTLYFSSTRSGSLLPYVATKPRPP